MDSVSSAGRGASSERSANFNSTRGTDPTGAVDATVRDTTITDVTTRLFRVPLDQVRHVCYHDTIEC